MFIKSFAAGPWQTDCYVVAPSAGQECIIIDPGMGATSGVADLIAEHHLHPVAVLLTHGHIDHMWSVFPVASGYSIPAVIHKHDRKLLSDPGLAISAETRAALPGMLGTDEIFAEPESVIELDAKTSLNLADFGITVHHAPGHTQGSVLYSFSVSPDDQFTQTVFTGDVLFAGAIGRTDLPGGSMDDMNKLLREVVLELADDSLVLPGHGPSSSMAIEKQNNPYLIRVAQGLSAV